MNKNTQKTPETILTDENHNSVAEPEHVSVYEVLSAINVNQYTEKKNGLTYLSWAWAWAELLKRYPESVYTVYERPGEYGPVNYFTDGRTCWVKTGVTVEGKEYIEMLPVMDFRNKAIPVDSVTSMDVNKAIQRSLTKAVARHGLGLYIYAGEDLPECERDVQLVAPAEEPKPTRTEAVRSICQELNISQETFGQLKKEAIDNGVIPEGKLVSKLSDTEFAVLTHYVRLRSRKGA